VTQTAPPLVLSVFATFAVGGPQVRFAALANHFGPAWRHAVIAMDGRYDCTQRLAPELDVIFPGIQNPRRTVLANVARFRRLLGDLAPDVLVTHNWGSIEWVLANLTSVRARHVHIEDGFGPEEADGQLRRRVVARRLLLRDSTVVLPSLTLLKIARETWRLPTARYIPNGLDLARFQPVDAAPHGPPRIGTVAALRLEKNLARLLRAAKLLLAQGRSFSLTIVGDGPERERLGALAAELGIGEAVDFTGAVPDPAAAYRDFDIFALSSDTEQMPLSVLDAMGAGLPVAATAVGDVPQMLARENQPFLCRRDDAALAEALARLLSEAGLRRRVGAANRLKAERDYDQDRMFRRYGELLTPDPGRRPVLAGT
jgi:glycosyltransferase involved in cell wall biosynthesis